MRIVLSCFYLLIFHFEKFSTWIWRLPFAVYVKRKLSSISPLATAIYVPETKILISTIKFEVARIHFLSDIFVDVAFVVNNQDDAVILLPLRPAGKQKINIMPI